MNASISPGAYDSGAIDDDLWLTEDEVATDDTAEPTNDDAPVSEPRKTMPCPASTHDALVLDIAARGRGVFTAVSETINMSPSDQGDALGVLLDELDAERARIVAARDAAYELAEVEAAHALADALESRWNASNGVGL